MALASARHPVHDALTLDLPPGPLRLLGGLAAFLPETGHLLVADAHLGKAHAFRAMGVPVPPGTTADNLQRLDRLIEATVPRELVFLGDLLHARHGRGDATMRAVSAWRRRRAALPMRLVRGNHDSRAGDPPPDWDVAVVDEPWRLGGWALCHHPGRVDGAVTIAGHVHPGVVLGSGLDRLRLPCFHVSDGQVMLPAFGAFTGLHVVRPAPGDTVVVVAEGRLRPLPA